MSLVRIALANLPFPPTPADSVASAVRAIADASGEHADIICFPEGFVPGYRTAARRVAPPDANFLDRAWRTIAEAAARANVAVVLGTERFVESDTSGVPGGDRRVSDVLRLSALVIDRDGTIDGVQDKVQLDPSEEDTYSPGSERRLFHAGPLTFGIAICHEGWRYPETVRWAAQRGAHIVFHPHFHEADAYSYRPSRFADPANSFHEKAALCRAAENTCYFATVNYASTGSPTTSAIVRPDGTLLRYQPYGVSGLLVADVDLSEATGLLASRCRSYSAPSS